MDVDTLLLALSLLCAASDANPEAPGGASHTSSATAACLAAYPKVATK